MFLEFIVHRFTTYVKHGRLEIRVNIFAIDNRWAFYFYFTQVLQLLLMYIRVKLLQGSGLGEFG